MGGLHTCNQRLDWNKFFFFFFPSEVLYFTECSPPSLHKDLPVFCVNGCHGRPPPRSGTCRLLGAVYQCWREDSCRSLVSAQRPRSHVCATASSHHRISGHHACFFFFFLLVLVTSTDDRRGSSVCISWCILPACKVKFQALPSSVFVHNVNISTRAFYFSLCTDMGAQSMSVPC